MPRRRLRITLVALALVVGAAGTYIHLRAAQPPSVATPIATSSPLAPSPADEPTTRPAPAPTVASITPRPPAAPSADPATALRDALTWQDDGARIDAIEAAIAGGATEVLPVLEHVVLREDPEGAPTIIHGVAVLGARAGAAERREAAQTLSSWLREETGREGADARGNVSVLVDALGDLGGADASRALADALDLGNLPLHVETLAAQRLTDLGDPGARDAIARFHTRVLALPPTDGIDESLRNEALAIATDVQR
jgi:hypothetical protein